MPARRFLPVIALVAVIAAVALAASQFLPRAASVPETDKFSGLSVVQPAPAGQTGSDAARGAGGSGSAALDTDQLIIFTGSLAVEVPDLDPTVIQANRLITGLGGRITASQRYGSQSSAKDGTPATGDIGILPPEPTPSTQPTAVITYRVPAARFQDAMDGLQKIGKVLSAETSSNEVTSQVLDLEARLRNLQATEAALMNIMARATQIKDVLAVQEQLTAVRGQIEELETEITHLRDQAAEATISATFSVPFVAVTAQQKGWSLATQIDAALAGLLAVGQFLAGVLVWAIILGLPLGVGGLVVFGPLAYLVLRFRRRSRPIAGGSSA